MEPHLERRLSPVAPHCGGQTKTALAPLEGAEEVLGVVHEASAVALEGFAVALEESVVKFVSGPEVVACSVPKALAWW